MFYFTNQEEIFCFCFFLGFFTFRSLKLHAIPRFYSGTICGPIWGSFVVLGSFAVQSGDHLRSGIICGFGIICGAVQYSCKISRVNASLYDNFFARFYFQCGKGGVDWRISRLSHFTRLQQNCQFFCLYWKKRVLMDSIGLFFVYR